MRKRKKGGQPRGQLSSSGKKRGSQGRPAVDSEEVDSSESLRLKRRMDDVALSLIILNVSEKLHYILRTGETAREAWLALAKHHQKTNSSKLILARNAFLNVKYKHGESMEEYLSRVDQLWDRANTYLEAAEKSRFDDSDKTMAIQRVTRASPHQL